MRMRSAVRLSMSQNTVQYRWILQESDDRPNAGSDRSPQALRAAHRARPATGTGVVRVRVSSHERPRRAQYVARAWTRERALPHGDVVLGHGGVAGDAG